MSSRFFVSMPWIRNPDNKVRKPVQKKKAEEKLSSKLPLELVVDISDILGGKSSKYTEQGEVYLADIISRATNLEHYCGIMGDYILLEDGDLLAANWSYVPALAGSRPEEDIEDIVLDVMTFFCGYPGYLIMPELAEYPFHFTFVDYDPRDIESRSVVTAVLVPDIEKLDSVSSVIALADSAGKIIAIYDSGAFVDEFDKPVQVSAKLFELAQRSLNTEFLVDRVLNEAYDTDGSWK